MRGKICVITGATSGIGRATAIGLGKLGADIIAIGRNERRGANVVQFIKSRPNSGKATFLRCDLSSQQQVRSLSNKIHGAIPRVDVLVNNAGAAFDTYQVSEDGIEMTFATNHLSHFLLTSLLLDLLLKTPEASIISVAGDSHFGVNADFAECLNADGYDRKKAKQRSKLANLMFIYELSERLKETKITSNAVHPGGVATRFGMNNGLFSWAKHIVAHTLKRNLISSKKGSDTVVYLASSNRLKGFNGKYYYCRKPKESSFETRDKHLIQKLWKLSVQMTNLNSEIGSVWQYIRPN